MLKHVKNFRDLGGIPCADARPIKPGRLFRTAALINLSDEDLSILRGLNLHTVIDLRSASERQRLPASWPDDFCPDTWHWDVNLDIQAENVEAFAILKADPTERGALNQGIDTYRRFPRVFAPRLAGLFQHLSAAQEQPVAFHCAIGKDRTGFLAGILLLALGAERETAINDYMLSKQHLDEEALTRLAEKSLSKVLGEPPSKGIIEPMISVRPELLNASFDWIDEQFGDVYNYLEQSAGISSDDVARLREACLE